MIHLTLNSGSSTPFDPAACHRGQVRKLRSLYPKGGLLPNPWPDLRVDFGAMQGAASFAIWRADVPILMNAVCWSARHAAEAWSGIESHYLSLSEQFPEVMGLFGTASHLGPPEETPWLATLLLPSLLHALPAAELQARMATIASMEQAMAAALIP